jgi:hypothetical protein
VKQLDRSDVVIGGGLLLLAIGVGAISVPWSCIVLGALLLLFGVAGVVRRGRVL